MPTRYLIDDLPTAKAFYVEQLGFEVVEEWGSAFAIVARGEAVLWLSGPETSAAKPMPDGRKPEPGGWNRIVLEYDDFDAVVEKLRMARTTFRNEPLNGPGGRQVLIEDPSGNPIEIFQARE